MLQLKLIHVSKWDISSTQKKWFKGVQYHRSSISFLEAVWASLILIGLYFRYICNSDALNYVNHLSLCYGYYGCIALPEYFQIGISGLEMQIFWGSIFYS